MPCRDDYAYHESIERTIDERKHLQAIVCGLLTYIEPSIPDILDKLDYNEMGVSQSYTKEWWKEHKEADQKRRRREQERKDRQARFNDLKRTLTPEDIQIIREYGK